MSGKVYWITGLSNSGKTTVGTALYYRLRQSIDNVVILDGDLMKEIASGKEVASYEEVDRKIRAKRYSLMAKMLSDQGLVVIVCAIAMYDEVREWNRKNIKGYVEIFLNPSDETLKRRDKKGLYKAAIDVELPKNPDATFENEQGDSVKEIVDTILHIEAENLEDYDRDKEYWNAYYKSIADVVPEPSNFARYVEKELRPNSHILELGCGNGRDSLFFASKGHNLIAVDGSDFAVNMLNEATKEKKDILFVCDNFVKCKSLYQMKYDCIYSRFTLHAITEEQEDELLGNIKEALAVDGKLYIEARTTKDAIWGKGKKIAHNTFIYNNHFRRFIDVDEFKNKLEMMGYKVLSIEEKNGFSKMQDQDPILMRCVATAK